MSKPHFFVSKHGVIVGKGMVPDGKALGAMTPEGCSAIAGTADPRTQYYDEATGKVCEKQVIPAVLSKRTMAADRVDEVSITGLPLGAVVLIEETPYEVNDGILEFTVDQPGEYPIRILALHHLPFETTVAAE